MTKKPDDKSSPTFQTHPTLRNLKGVVVSAVSTPHAPSFIFLTWMAT